MVAQGESQKRSPHQALTQEILLVHHLPLRAYLLNEGTHRQQHHVMPNQRSKFSFYSMLRLSLTCLIHS